MADRSQNIVINYKFNTAEIEKASAILNRANQATNTLQQAAQKSGQSISQSYGKAGTSIEAMNIQLARLKTQISVSSDPKRVADLSNQYKVLKTQIDAATASAFKLPKALNETKAATQSLAGQFGQLYTAAKLLITAGIVREVVNIGLEFASLKGNVEGVEQAFNRTFTNEIHLLNDLRKSTHGTITDFQLMQRALKAQNLGVPIKELGTLLEFAAVRAQQTGDSVDYLVNSIIDGLGRKSILKLDNLGVSASRLKEAMGGVSTQTATVAQVTEAFTKVANEELQKMGGYAETSATQVSQLKVEAEELRITLAKKLESGWWIDFLKESAEGWQVILKGRKEVTQEFLRSIGAEQAARVKEGEAFKAAGSDRQKQFDVIQQEINTRLELVGRTNDNIQAKKDELANTQVWSVSLQKMIKTTRGPEVDAINEAIMALEKRKFVQAAAILALKEYREEILKLIDTEVLEFETIDKLQEKLKGLKEQREGETFTGNKPELDRLQREIILLEDRILKISDNIKWQQQWNHEREQSALTTANETEELKLFNDELDKLTAKMASGPISFSTGELLPTDITESIDIAALEESLAEIAEPVADSFWTKFRLAFKNGAEDSSNDLQQAINEAMDTLKLGVLDIAQNQATEALQIDLDNMKRRLGALRNFYDEQQLLAGDNERAKSQLRVREERETTLLQRRIFEKEKQTRRAQAVIDGAAGVVKAFATYPWPAALIISALIAAQTTAQIANINRQRSGYAKGVLNLQGPGTGTSDSIQANLSKGESVMTAWETKHAGNVLKDIRAKKLDDKVLKDLKQGRPAAQQQFNDERIIKAIEKNRPPDVAEQGGILYETKSKGDNYRLKQRSKSGRFRI